MVRPNRVTLLLACTGQFLVVMDISVVNVALPSIQRELGFSAVGLQWVVSGYALGFAGFLLLGGRLADAYGTRCVYTGGLTLIGLASLVGGLASSPEVLIAARALQGLGASVLTPATLTMLTTALRGEQRVRAVAAWTAVASAGGAAGNLLGGALTEYASWRATLLVNVPVGAALLAGALATVARRPATGARLDVPGAVLATVGLTALTYGVTGRHGDGPTVTALAVGSCALVGFVVVERRAGAAALVPSSLVTIRSVAVGNVVMFVTGAALMPMWYFLSLYLQQVLHYDALRAGLGFLPHTLITVVVSAAVVPAILRRFSARSRTGRPVIVGGALVASAGFCWQSQVGPGSGYLLGILAPGVLIATGAGLLGAPITSAATSGVALGDAGAAAGLMNTTKQFGAAIGLAALVATTEPGSTPESYRVAFLAIAGLLVLASIAALALPAWAVAPPAPATARPSAPPGPG